MTPLSTSQRETYTKLIPILESAARIALSNFPNPTDLIVRTHSNSNNTACIEVPWHFVAFLIEAGQIAIDKGVP